MSKQMAINVDLADVFAQPGRKEFPHTLAWGDRVEVMETTAAELPIRTTKFETQADGSILPVKTEAFITPTKRYPGTTPEKPKTIDCILVTHGAADHFPGSRRSTTRRPTRSPGSGSSSRPAARIVNRRG